MLVVSGAEAINLPPNFDVLDLGPGATFDRPVALAFSLDGRIFVAERRGRIYVLEPDPAAADPRSGYVKLEPPFLQIDDEVLDNVDRGLLGLALDPDFVNNGYVYFGYVAETDPSNPDQTPASYSKVERVTASTSNPNQADLSTRLVLIGETWTSGITTTHYSHVIGTLVFGDDGTLLVSHGDGASFNVVDPGGLFPDSFLPGRSDPDEDVGSFRSQYLGSLSGKVLRIDPATGDGVPSNPHYDPLAPRSPQSRTWAMGLRNPYRMDLERGSGSSDPSAGSPGRLAVGDVGWNSREELNLCLGGENFGWPCYEGFAQQSGYQQADPMHSGCTGDDAGLTYPIVEFPHGSGTSVPFPGLQGNAIVGATFCAGTNYPPAYRNLVYFAEYVRRWVYAVRLDASGAPVELVDFATDTPTAVELRADPYSGDLFTVNYSAGTVRRYVYNGSTGGGQDPVQPQGLTLIATAGQIALQWDPNPESDIIGYHVYRATAAEGPWTQLTTNVVVAPEYVDDGSVAPLVPGIVYWYEVEARDSEGRASPRSEPASALLPEGGWEWYVPHPGPALSQLEPPAPYPRQIALPDPFVSPNYDHWTSADRAPQLRKVVLNNEDFVLETRLSLVSFNPSTNFHTGILVGFSQYDALVWGPYRNTTLRLERPGLGNLGEAANSSSTIALRVVRTGNEFSFEYRVSEQDPWSVGATYTTPSIPSFAGVIVKSWSSTTIPLVVDLDALGFNEIPPVASAAASPLSGPAPLSVDFTSNSYDPNGALLFHHWDFGDGGVSNESDPTHLFATPGPWTVVLEVRDESGFSDADTLTVIAEGNRPPVATIVSPPNGFEYVDPSAPIALDATASDPDEPTSSLSFEWSIDLHHGLQDTLGYIIPAPGAQSSFVPGIADDGQGIRMDVILTVTDSEGLAAMDTVTVIDASLPPSAVLDLRAALADGSQPPAIPGAAGPWANLGVAGSGADAVLQGFAGTANSGWEGSGSPGAPYQLVFDGLDDVAVVPAQALAGLEDGASVELWLRTPEDVTSRSYVLEWLESYTPPFPGCSISIEAGQLRLYLGGWANLVTVAPNRWMHLIVVKETSQWRAYVDGALVGNGAGANLGAQSSELVLGAGTFAGAGQYAEHFAGSIAELRVFDFALSQTNVSVLSELPPISYRNAPRVYAADPAFGFNDETVADVLVHGLDFVDGVAVWLERLGETDLPANFVQFVDSGELRVDLPLNGALPGMWSLWVENPDGQRGALLDGFEVREPSAVFLELLAHQVDGLVPPTVPSAQSPWTSTVGAHALDLSGFAGDEFSGWQGDGAYAGPFHLRFDGSDDVVRLAPASLAALDTLDQISVELWIRSAATAAPETILEWVQTEIPYAGWSLFCDNGLLYLRRDESPPIELGAIPSGPWTALTVTQDLSRTAAYIDGTMTFEGAGGPIAAQDSALTLGAGFDASNFFAGDLAIARIAAEAYDTATVADRHALDFSLFAALPQAVLSLQAAAAIVGEGDSVLVRIEYDDQGDPFGLRGASLRLSYDPSLLEFVSASEGEFLPPVGQTFFASDGSSPGEVVIDTSLLGSTAGASGMGSLASVRFQSTASATDTITALQLEVLGLPDVQDPPGQIPFSNAGSLNLRLDSLGPEGIVGLEAAAADSAALVRWVAPLSEPVDVVLLSRPWSLAPDGGFPRYGRLSPAPDWPSDLDTALAEGWSQWPAVETDSLRIPAGRTVLSVMALSRDAVGNYADFGSAPRLRVATYRLGDLGEIDAAQQYQATFDGFIDRGRDGAVLRSGYGLTEADTNFVAVADMAPSSDATASGWPQPDGIVSFEDLMIFALDFDPEIPPSTTNLLLGNPEGSGAMTVRLKSPVSIGGSRIRYALELINNSGDLRALHVPLLLTGSAAASATFHPQEIWSRPLGFQVSYAHDDSFVVDFAALGTAGRIGGDGPLGWIEFDFDPASPVTPVFGQVAARDLAGEPLVLTDEVQVPVAAPAPPLVTRLHRAVPNPFNPRTTLSFDLAEPGPVRLRIYSVAGRLIDVLVDAALAAGPHRYVWDGRDQKGEPVGSGVYLYELQCTDGVRRVAKMTLLK